MCEALRTERGVRGSNGDKLESGEAKESPEVGKHHSWSDRDGTVGVGINGAIGALEQLGPEHGLGCWWCSRGTGSLVYLMSPAGMTSLDLVISMWVASPQPAWTTPGANITPARMGRAHLIPRVREHVRE